MSVHKKYKWLLLLVLLLLAGVVVWKSPRSGRAQQHFEEKMFVGFDDNVSLTPVLAQLSPRENSMYRGLTRESKAMFAVFPRILRGEGTHADFLDVTSTNWSKLACIDDCRGTLVGAQVWRKAVEAILQHPDTSPAACADRLRNWPPALRHLGLARTFEKNFIATVVNRVCRDAEIVEDAIGGINPTTNTLELAAALYEAGSQFHDYPPAANWRDRAEKGMVRYFARHQKPDGSTGGDLAQSVADIETVVHSLALGYRAGVPVSKELAGPVQKLMDVMMMTLDMDGGLPFRDPEQRFYNKREWMFWAGRIFHRRDYAWIGYGGSAAMDALPPARTNAFFADLGLGIMRNHWDVSWYMRRGEQPEHVCEVRIPHSGGTNETYAYQYNHFSNNLRMDAKNGVIEVHAFGEQQMRVTLPWNEWNLVSWSEDENGVTFAGTKGNVRVCVTQPRGAEAWVVHVAGLATSDCLRVRGLHATFLEATNSVGMVTQTKCFSPRWEWSTVLRIKPAGSLCLKTDGVLSGYDGTNVEVRASANDSLTLVMLGAAGIWPSNWNQWPTPASCVMAEARQTTFAPGECTFEAWASKLPFDQTPYNDFGNLTMVRYHRPGNKIYHLVFNDTATTPADWVRVSFRAMDKPSAE
jgi:hypothetical protein